MEVWRRLRSGGRGEWNVTWRASAVVRSKIISLSMLMYNLEMLQGVQRGLDRAKGPVDHDVETRFSSFENEPSVRGYETRRG